MKSNWIALSAFLQAHVLAADAQVFGLTDPRLCYLLDGLLLIYAIIITALLFREKLSKRPPGDTEDDTFSKPNQNTRDHFGNRADAEVGGRRGKHRSPDNSLYQDLQISKLNDPYNEIGMKKQPKKKGKGNDMVYQGLSTGNREMYDALQMKKLQH
ncbi:T-cell surface glycoprotein CD3 zeta chain [Aquarana catesbeiana]|uniref:T-cell surface glycoprotein CD3 zeta chain n=1 Tax=Aquarana catesbeiana TaxID=8400 RepID=UPI003CC97E37